MKRVVFAALLLVVVIVLNAFCLYVVKETKESMISRLDELSAIANTQKAAETASEITDYWIDTHHILCRIVRHKLLEQVTISVSRLEPLARYGETGLLSAEISNCRLLVEEIWDSERPILRNIF